MMTSFLLCGRSWRTPADYQEGTCIYRTNSGMSEAAENIPPANCHRLVLLGSSKVGKTSLVNRFLKNKFEDVYTPTIEDFHRKIYRIKGQSYRLDLLDTSGNHPFPAIRRLSIITGDIFLLIYDICDRESFNEVTRLCQQVYEIKGQCRTGTVAKLSIPMVIVGNKHDREKHREIDFSEGEELSRQYTNVSFVETSAKRNVNVEEAFIRLFTLAKLPPEMSPSLHRKVHPTVLDDEISSAGRKSVSIRRRLSEACGTIAPNARRPSIRTDLLTAQMRSSTSRSLIENSNANSKCVIQ